MRPVRKRAARRGYGDGTPTRHGRVVARGRTHRTGPGRHRGEDPWRFGTSLAMLLTVALGAGLLTAGFTLPAPQPPQPPSAPAGDLADIPGFLPDDAPGRAEPPGGVGRADDGSASGTGSQGGGADAEPNDDPATGRDAAGVARPGAPVAERPGADPLGSGGRGLTATRAPADPPPIPAAGSGPPQDAASARHADTAADAAGSRHAAPRPGGPPLPPAGDPLAPAPDQGGPAAGAAALPALQRSQPRRIGIPSIGVDAEVIGVGVDDTGEMEVPPLETPMLAGWYRLGPSPGELGNSVIVGHVDTRKKGPAVFFNLGRLRKGDLITVTRADGTVVRFAVDDVRLFAKSSFPSQAVYGTGDESRLRIVTCGGRYDRTARDYLDNVVAFASRVP